MYRELIVQESLADAKVSARQQRNLRQIYARNTVINWVTTLSLTIRVYLHSFSCYCLPNLRNPAKFSENSNLERFKVI